MAELSIEDWAAVVHASTKMFNEMNATLSPKDKHFLLAESQHQALKRMAMQKIGSMEHHRSTASA